MGPLSLRRMLTLSILYYSLVLRLFQKTLDAIRTVTKFDKKHLEELKEGIAALLVESHSLGFCWVLPHTLALIQESMLNTDEGGLF